MNSLSVALPIFNGASLLDEALANVLNSADRSTMTLRVHVYDNASEDESLKIANGWAARDSRIEVVPRKKNIGAVANFADAALRANSTYFAWRAYDDLSSQDYFRHLIEALDNAPAAVLAVPQCVTVRLQQKSRRTRPAPAGLIPLTDSISHAQPGWLYGVWRTQHARAACSWAEQYAPGLWGWDHLALLHAALAGPFVGCAEAQFLHRLSRGPGKAKAGHSSGEKQQLRKAFREAGRDLICSTSDVDRAGCLNALDVLIERRVIRRPLRTPADLLVKLRAHLT